MINSTDDRGTDRRTGDRATPGRGVASGAQHAAEAAQGRGGEEAREVEITPEMVEAAALEYCGITEEEREREWPFWIETVIRAALAKRSA